MSGASVADVVVVGSGAGGGFVAMALAEAGVRVLLLERGRAFDPRHDFPSGKPEWESLPSAFTDTAGADSTIVPQDGEALDRRWSRLQTGRLPLGPPPTRRERFRYQRVIGLGGTTLHYQGEAHRFGEHAFRSSSLYGFGIDWPVDYAELAPYYERAEQVLGVAGDPGNPFKPKRGVYPTPAHRLSYASQRVRAGASRLGWALLPNALALPSRSVDERAPCQKSGMCVYGCAFGAKSSVDLTAIPRGVRTGRLTVRTGARVVGLDVAPNGRVSAVLYRSGRATERAAAGAVVLALGAVETPRLLLAHRSARHPHGLANDSGVVGRYLMETLYAVVNARFEERLDGYKGPPIDARIWNFCRPRAGERVRSGYVLGVSGTSGGFHGPVSYALRTPGFGRAHKQAVRARYGTVLSLFGIAEQEPRASNRVWLADDRDADGVPRVKVESRLSDTDHAAIDAMLDRVKALAAACNSAEILHQITAYDEPQGQHVVGTCRMGRDSASSVVDAHGRAHSVPNLFIADASVLPGQGAGDSPSLTIQALALRTAEHIVSLARRHEL